MAGGTKNLYLSCDLQMISAVPTEFNRIQLHKDQMHSFQFRIPVCPGIAQSVLRLATGWTVRGSNPSGDEIFYTRSDRSWGLPSLLHNGYRVYFPGVMRPGRGVNHPPSSSAEVKGRVELYLYSPSGLSWPVLGRTLYLSATGSFVLQMQIYISKTTFIARSQGQTYFFRIKPRSPVAHPIALSL